MTYVFILFVVGYSAISVGQRYDFSGNLTRPTQSPAARWECGALGGSIHYKYRGGLLQQGLHLGCLLLEALEVAELSARALEVVLGRVDLEVGISVEVVDEEAYRLHIGHQTTTVGDEAALGGREELTRRGEVALDEGLVDLHVHADLREVCFIFGSEVHARTDEVTHVAEDEAWHNGIPVDDAEYSTRLIEEDVVDLCVAVDGALGELALSVELLLEEHRVSTAVDLSEDVLHFGDTASGILGDSVAELLQAEGHAVEVLNGLTKTTLGDDGEDFFELTEGGTSIAGGLGGKLAHAHALGDEAADTPVVLPVVVVVLLGLLEVGVEVEVLTLCFGITFGFEALAHRVGYDSDIALQDFDAGEDEVVHTL